MKLYYAPGTCTLASWIALEWAGADYEVAKVKLGSPEYLKSIRWGGTGFGCARLPHHHSSQCNLAVYCGPLSC